MLKEQAGHTLGAYWTRLYHFAARNAPTHYQTAKITRAFWRCGGTHGGAKGAGMWAASRRDGGIYRVLGAVRRDIAARQLSCRFNRWRRRWEGRARGNRDKILAAPRGAKLLSFSRVPRTRYRRLYPDWATPLLPAAARHPIFHSTLSLTRFVSGAAVARSTCRGVRTSDGIVGRPAQRCNAIVLRVCVLAIHRFWCPFAALPASSPIHTADYR